MYHEWFLAQTQEQQKTQSANFQHHKDSSKNRRPHQKVTKKLFDTFVLLSISTLICQMRFTDETSLNQVKCKSKN